MTNLVEAAGGTLRGALADAALGLVGREVVVELVALAAVAGEHVLIIGPPGTAKSEAVRRVAAALGGTYFEYLLGRFTEPSEVFGPIDLRKLREGRVETETAGMLPEADVAFRAGRSAHRLAPPASSSSNWVSGTGSRKSRNRKRSAKAARASSPGSALEAPTHTRRGQGIEV